jgi:hypothetical protein
MGRAGFGEDEINATVGFEIAQLGYLLLRNKKKVEL